MGHASRGVDGFYALSVALAGRSEFELRATGVGEQYLAQLVAVAGQSAVDEMVTRFHATTERCGTDQACLTDGLRRELFADEWLGPLSRNLVKMWYVGNWYQLPPFWRANHGVSPADATKVVCAQAYVEGLVWKALGTHAGGAKEPGYGTWAEPPAPLGGSPR